MLFQVNPWFPGQSQHTKISCGSFSDRQIEGDWKPRWGLEPREPRIPSNHGEAAGVEWIETKATTASRSRSKMPIGFKRHRRSLANRWQIVKPWLMGLMMLGNGQFF